VEQRQHAVDDVVGLGAVGCGQVLLDVRQQVAVAEHRRPRGAGGPAGEHERGEVIGCDVDNRVCLGLEQLVERDGAVDLPLCGDHRMEAGDGGTIDVGPRGHRRRSDQHGDRADGTQLALDLGGGLAGLSGTTTAPRPTIAR
jgi:hypothetical protein